MGETFFHHRPFKPLVERSSRSTLTFYFLLWLVAAPAGGVKFEPLHAHFVRCRHAHYLFNCWLVAAPTGGVGFEPLRLTTFGAGTITFCLIAIYPHLLYNIIFEFKIIPSFKILFIRRITRFFFC